MFSRWDAARRHDCAGRRAYSSRLSLGSSVAGLRGCPTCLAEDAQLRSNARYRLTTIETKRAKSLLYPIAAFLRQGGFSRNDSLEILSSAFDSLERGNRNVRMEHIGHPTRYADIIAAWTRDREYLDASGRPRALALSGAKGFASLVHRVSPYSDVQTALSVLLRYKNIRRSKDGKYLLAKPFFATNSSKTTAFEPIAYFLSDASATLTEMLVRQQRTVRPEPFWRKVETIDVSDRLATKFLAYARERSFLFLEELDDWLEAHRDIPAKTIRKRRRIGLGLFSIYSDYESAPANVRRRE